MWRSTILLLLAAVCAPAHPGWGIVLDERGNVFYTDLRQVWKVSPDGRKSVVVAGVHTHELYLDERGTLHGEHLWYDNPRSKWGHYLWELAADGRLVRHPPAEGFKTISFVRDRNGAMYWLEATRVMKRAPAGNPELFWELATQLTAPGRAPGGILADGAMYLVSGGDLLRISAGGKSHRLASGLNEHTWTAVAHQPWHYVMGLAADSAGNVYVANTGARKLKKVASGGAVTTVLSAWFPWAPTGVALHGKDVYVLEYSDTGRSVRVRRVAADGRITTLP